MHASIVVLSALVAVATGQFYGHWGMMPLNPALGVPFDEPAVHMGKVFNAQQHAIRGGMTYVVRKRREAAAPEAPAAAAAAAAAEATEAQPEKRQILAYSGLGYAGLGYAGLGYAGWSTPYLGYGYGAYPYGLYRKRRDVSEEAPATETSAEESQKEKRQLGYLGYGYGGIYSPYMRTFGGIYGGYPYLFRKRRDTSETESPEQAPAMDEQSRDKRQFYGLGYGWGYPSMYSGVYSPVWGRSHMLYRKRRDTDSQAAPAAEDSTAQESGRDKRQYWSPLAYSAYTPYMMGYGYRGFGYRGWY